VPLHTSYVLATTLLRQRRQRHADSRTTARGTPFPLDEGGVSLGALPVRGVFTVTFDVRVARPLAPDVDRVHNVAYVTVGADQRAPEVETAIVQQAGDRGAARSAPTARTPTRRPGPILAAGAPVTWTYTLTNTGDLHP
jgi:hypothetical protein